MNFRKGLSGLLGLAALVFIAAPLHAQQAGDQAVHQLKAWADDDGSHFETVDSTDYGSFGSACPNNHCFQLAQDVDFLLTFKVVQMAEPAHVYVSITGLCKAAGGIQNYSVPNPSGPYDALNWSVSDGLGDPESVDTNYLGKSGRYIECKTDVAHPYKTEVTNGHFIAGTGGMDGYWLYTYGHVLTHQMISVPTGPDGGGQGYLTENTSFLDAEIDAAWEVSSPGAGPPGGGLPPP